MTATADWANAANKADTANTVRTKVFTHVAAGTDPSSWAFTIGGTASAVGGIVAYSGVDTASPVDAAAVAQDSATTSHSAPSVTTTVAGDKLVAVYGLTANTTVTPAAGMADRADQGLAGTNPLTVAVDDVDVAAAGATPAKTATSAAAANAAIATVALKPAGGGTSTTTRYGFTGDGDTPDFTMNSAGAVVERDVALLGGVTITKRSGGDVWSYPNIHGDTTATADATGAKNGSTLTYDPFGQQLAGTPDNSDGNYDYGWLGSKQRGLEHEADINTIEMGARQYVPGLGRFLETDPIEGGSATAYDYTNQDPVNGSDLDGNSAKNQFGCGVNWPDGDRPYLRSSSGRTRVGQKARFHCPHNPGTMRLTITVYRKKGWFWAENMGSQSYTLTGGGDTLRPKDFSARCAGGTHTYWAIVVAEAWSPDGKYSRYSYMTPSVRLTC